MDWNVTNKKELRARLKLRRSELMRNVGDGVNQAITDRFLGSPSFHDADLTLMYLSFGSELDTLQIIRKSWSLGKQVAVPRCVPGQRKMTWHVISSFEQVSPGSYGILEPVEELTELVDPFMSAPMKMVVVVPGLAFDRRGFRIGYGGGYYDVFLSSFMGKSVGLCASELVADSLVELGVLGVYDLPVDEIVTENGIIRVDDSGGACEHECL